MSYFEYRDEKSAKFWQIEQQGVALHISWGKINTSGQSQVKSFADEAKASAAKDKLIKEKTGKGYQEVAGKAQPISAPNLVPTPTVAAADVATVVTTDKIPEVLTLAQKLDKTLQFVLEQIAAGKINKSITSNRIAGFFDLPEYAAEYLWTQLKGLDFFSYYGNELTSNATEIAAQLLQQLTALPTIHHTNPHIHLGRLEQLLFQYCYPSRHNPLPLSATPHTWSELAYRQKAHSLLLIEASASDLQAAINLAMRSLTEPQPATEPLAQAILMKLFLAAGNDVLSSDYIDFHIAQHGLVTTFTLFLQTQQLGLESQWDRQAKQNYYILNHTINQPWENCNYYRMLGLGEARLRAQLALADVQEYQQCVALAHQQLLQIAPKRQALIALIFPDEVELSHRLLRHYAQLDNPPESLHWLILTATDTQLIQYTWKIGAQSRATYMWYDTAVPLTILREREHIAVYNLAPFVLDEKVGWVLAKIGTVESLTVLARNAGENKTALACFNFAVALWPNIAIPALTGLIANNPKFQTLLLPTLLQLVRVHSEQAALCKPSLDSAAQNLLDKVEQQLNGLRAAARVDELPEVLKHVPWEQATPTCIAMQIEPMQIEPVEDWCEEEKSRVLSTSSFDRQFPNATIADIVSLLGFHYKDSGGNIQTAINAVNNNDIHALLNAWKVMHACRTNENRHEPYQYILQANRLARLPASVGIPFWNTIAGQTPCENSEYLMARFGTAALPGLLAQIKLEPLEHSHLIWHFASVALAPVVARIFCVSKKQYKLAQLWLSRFPEHAACGLIAPALGKSGEAQKNAATALRWLNQNGYAEVLQQVVARYQQAEVVSAFNAMLNENPLQRYPAKRNKLPAFWQPLNWRRPCLHNGKALPEQSLDIIGTMLTFPTNDGVYAGITQLVEACERQSLADFGWDCFSAWLANGAPGKEGWALTCLGYLGNDDTARKLAPMIRAWPGESAHARAVNGLDVLANIGSDVALMLLNGIAHKVKFKGLQERANEKITAIAQARGLTQQELDDRLVPDLGLDAQGSLLLDFGPRQFKVGFDETLKPYVREWKEQQAGKRLTDLPKPNKSDDAERAAAAVEQFKLLKKDARTLASQQLYRLEQVMCQRRRWTIEVFEQFIAQHPLICHLARRLVWAVYQDDGKAAAYFRVTEDGSYSNAEDDDYPLPTDASCKIGLPHALEIDPQQAAAFGQLFADYELIQPFSQLDRDSYSLTEEEKAATKLMRWHGRKVATGKVLGLVNHGWQRGPAQDAGCILTFEKVIDEKRIIELCLDPGIIVGYIEEYPEQTLHELTLGPPHRWGAQQNLQAFGTLDDIFISELIRDMERLI